MFFMNFRLGDSPGKLHTDIVLSDRDTHEVFSDKLRFIFIELPAFTKEEEKCITDFERWIYVLKNMKTLNRLPFKARKAVFEKLEKITDKRRTRKVRRKYQGLSRPVSDNRFRQRKRNRGGNGERPERRRKKRNSWKSPVI